MVRYVVGCGLLLFSALQVGCYGPLYDRVKCSGCGPLYLGAYVDDPPRCEPCDRCGNYTGCGCDPCESRFPWSRARMFQSLHDWACRSDARCCGGDGCCGQRQEVGCADAGDVGCGNAGPINGQMNGNSYGEGEVIYENAPEPVSTTSGRSPAKVRPVSQATVVAARPQEAGASRSPARCNCGRQH
jgi:hypothetical protein